MFCSHCGATLPEGAAFCAGCGAKVEAAQPVYAQPVYTQPVYTQPVYTQPAQTEPAVLPPRPQEDPELEALGRTTMILGIVGLALCESGLPGLIVSGIAMNKAAEFERRAGSLYGKARIGRRLAKPGKIVGIIMTVLWCVFAVVYGILYGILLSELLY